tara:strand:- start:1175 stop:1411 length:237 start_codon:yes stop_codon:yes gene_type:complete
MTDDTKTEDGPFSESLVGGATLLETIFADERDRPTLRWLASMRQRRLIPYKKIGGRLIRYDVGEVRAALDRNFSVEAK